MTDFTPTPEPPTVALVYDNDGDLYDRCYGWEAAQSYALHEGLRVIAVTGDAHLSKAECQDLYDDERERYRNCWGITDEPAPIKENA